MEIIEKDFHRTNRKRFIHTLCLLLPIGMAFLGYFIASPLWNVFTAKKTTELFKFICSVVFFGIPAIIIFIISRKESPVMKMRISER